MSLEDLEEHGVALPRKLWGRMDLSTPVNKPALSAAFLVGTVSCLLMVIGGGGSLTWAGALLFVCFLLIFTLVSNAGIEKQNRRCERLLREPTSADD